jgi:hypothetical protein
MAKNKSSCGCGCLPSKKADSKTGKGAKLGKGAKKAKKTK